MARPDLDPKAATALRGLLARFTGNVPQAARGGAYEPKPGDGLGDDDLDVPNGTYRVHGSDWLITIAKKRFTLAARAMPPKFGGANVIQVFENNQTAAAPGEKPLDTEKLVDEGWWSPQTVETIRQEYQALCKEPPYEDDRPNIKFQARMIVLAGDMGLKVADKDLEGARSVMAAAAK